MMPYKPPAYKEEAFNCPHCNAYANQLWQQVYIGSKYTNFEPLDVAFCAHCDRYTLWHEESMIFPEDSGVPPPNPDLDSSIQEDYLEAKNIMNKSPRGAAAMLRLGIQKLCRQLGQQGDDLNKDIGILVKNGLPAKIQKSLDIVRVIGNNAVHPGQIDLKDNRDTALSLFDLVNMIADVMISQPKQVEGLYESLPTSAKKQIEVRDKGE